MLPKFMPISFFRHPEGLERHLDAARQKLLRDNFAAQLPRNYPHRRGNLKEEKSPLLWGRAMWEAF